MPCRMQMLTSPQIMITVQRRRLGGSSQQLDNKAILESNRLQGKQLILGCNELLLRDPIYILAISILV